MTRQLSGNAGQLRKPLPLPSVPDPIRFSLTIDGAVREIAIPVAHADRPVPFAPVLDFSMLHNAHVFITRR